MEMLKSRWKEFSPEKKRMTILGGLAAALVLGSIIFDSALPEKGPTKKEMDASDSMGREILVQGRTRNTAGEALAAKQEKAERKMQTQEKLLLELQRNQIDQAQAETDFRNSAETMRALRDEIESMRSEVAMLKSGIGDTGKPVRLPELKSVDDALVQMPPLGGANAPMVQAEENVVDVEDRQSVKSGPRLRVTSGSGNSSSGGGGGSALDSLGSDPALPNSGKSIARAAGKGAIKNGKRLLDVRDAEQAERTYLPAGSILQGVLLNGMDAPTNGVGQNNPVPGLIRIDADAILPNRFKHDVKQCFAIVAGKGSLSSERVELRTETLSCIRRDGGVVEAAIDGYVTGEDGKVGMRGRLVSKQGAILARSLIAGTLSGFGKALQPSAVPSLNVSGGSNTQSQTLDLGTAAQGGVLGGAAQASSDLAKFYLELAKEVFPVLELDAGRRVNLILVRGTELSFGVKQ